MFASVINHGSAAVAQTTAGLPPSAAGSLEHTQPPSAASVTQAATGSLGNSGIEYPSPSRMRSHHGAPLADLRPAPGAARMAAASPMSVLGAELSDDSLTLSPEQLFTPGSTRKRGSKVRGYSNKRLAVSVPRPARKASPSPSGDAARRRGPGTTEERLQFLALQRAADQAEIVRMRGSRSASNGISKNT